MFRPEQKSCSGRSFFVEFSALFATLSFKFFGERFFRSGVTFCSSLFVPRDGVEGIILQQAGGDFSLEHSTWKMRSLKSNLQCGYYIGEDRHFTVTVALGHTAYVCTIPLPWYHRKRIDRVHYRNVRLKLLM